MARNTFWCGCPVGLGKHRQSCKDPSDIEEKLFRRGLWFWWPWAQPTAAEVVAEDVILLGGGGRERSGGGQPEREALSVTSEDVPF